jgi:hypothetical protein
MHNHILRFSVHHRLVLSRFQKMAPQLRAAQTSFMKRNCFPFWELGGVGSADDEAQRQGKTVEL